MLFLILALLGGITGLLYLASLAANGYSIHKNGAILSSVFTRLGGCSTCDLAR